MGPTPILLAVGVLLRTVAYLSNRSLWLDEATLANNVLTRSFARLIEKLDHEDTAPVGFLEAEKVVSKLFGGGELALRLVPFLAGLAALFLFARVARRCLPAAAVPLGVALFAIGGSLVYYSSELKPYSTDVAVALLLTDLALSARQDGRSGRRALAALAAVGVVAIPLSHPAIFGIAAAGLSLFLSAAVRRDRSRAIAVAAVGALWIAAFAASYLLFLRRQTHDSVLVNYWSDDFMPFPPRSTSDLLWYPRAIRQLFSGPVGLEFAGLGALAAITGTVRLWASDRVLLGIFAGPGLFALAASALHAYPFSGRLLLFFVPSVVLLVALGTSVVRDATRSTAPVVGIALLVLLFLHPTLYAAQTLLHPKTREEIRPVLASVRDHRAPGDRLFVHRSAGPAFEYYSKRYGFDPREATVGGRAKEWTDLRAQIHPLPEGKTWFVFSHAIEIDGADAERVFVSYLDDRGPRLAEYRAPGAAAYLYELKPRAPGCAGAANGTP